MTEGTRKIRLDQLLVKKGLAESREKAKAAIMAGLVQVDGQLVDKAGRLVASAAHIALKKAFPPYVSRGGLKLEAAIRHFSVDVADRVLLDVGASTGGFTDCLLQHGAKKVIAVDVGYGQFHYRLRNDPRVVLLERVNARFLSPREVPETIQWAVIDVSFISLLLILPPVAGLLHPKGGVIALVKPQFEAGRDKVPKGGVIRDRSVHREVLENLIGEFGRQDWVACGLMPSPIQGASGNREYLVNLRRPDPAEAGFVFPIDIDAVVERAFSLKDD